MLDHRRRRQAAIGTAQVRRHILARLGQAFDMRLVDDGVFPGDGGAHLAPAPVEGFVDHDRLRHAARIVAAVEGEVLACAPGAIAEMRVAPHQAADEPLGIGIEQQLVGVEAVPALGRIGAVDAIAIELPGRDVVEIAVPDVLAALRQFDPLEFAAALAVEQAKLDLFRIGREQRKVGAPSVPACSEAGGASRGQSHASAFRYEKDRGQRRDGQAEFGNAAFQSVDFADIADVAAAIMRGVGIERFLPLAGERHPDAVIAIDVR